MSSRQLPDILTDEEERQLLKVFDRRYPTAFRNRAMIWLALETGARVGDLLKMKWEDIELDSGRWHIKQGKGKKDRVVFIKPEVLSEMVDMAAKMKRKRTGLVFTTLQGKPVQDQYLREMIGRMAKKAGIEKRVHFHLLRHTALTKLYTETKDIRLVQQVAGHASIATTQIYTHVSGEDVREAMLHKGKNGNGARAVSSGSPPVDGEPIEPKGADSIGATLSQMKAQLLALSKRVKAEEGLQ